MALPGPFCCRGSLIQQGGGGGFPMFAFAGPFSSSSVCFDGSVNKWAHRMVVSSGSDYSKRRPRKSMIPKTKGFSAPKGFAPKPPAGMGRQKREQSDPGKKDSLNSNASSELIKGASLGKVRRDESLSDASRSDGASASRADGEEMGDKYLDDNVNVEELVDVTLLRKDDEEQIAEAKGGSKALSLSVQTLTLVHSPDDGEMAKAINKASIFDDQLSMTTSKQDQQSSLDHEFSMASGLSEQDFGNSESEEHVEGTAAIESVSEDPSEEEEDPQARMDVIQDLAERNLDAGNKTFVFPEVVKCDQVLEIYLNRASSVLANEAEVHIMGAFNGWKWNFFTKKLQKSNLNGDWWSCELHVPEQAYRIDFVFFNGNDVYENNDANDFAVVVENSIDEATFEELLLEEKRKELERLAAEQAEKERQAEEQRRLEEERVASEADRAQAKVEVEKRREGISRAMNLANTLDPNALFIEPNAFTCGDTIRIFYNRSSRPLNHAMEIWIHGGYNNWGDGLCIVERLERSDRKDGDWWYANVLVPDRALVLDWVFADGPPQGAHAYDNNDFKDFHVATSSSVSELFWVEEEQRIYKRLQWERKQKEEAVQRKIEKISKMKAQMKERTMQRFLLSQKHIFYTDPLVVEAGSTITLFYNPSHTVLNGKSEVWLHCSFNRWSYRGGALPPQKMMKTGNGPYLETKVRIPLDAYMMDFVFSEKEDGGIFDNRNDMDYHIPVSGGLHKEPPMHIVHIAVEMAPIAKVGGLGDVVTSLSRAVQDLGHKVEIIFPKYDCLNLSNVKDLHFLRSYSWGETEIKVWFGKVEGLSVHFLEPQNGMFWVGCVYGRNDDSRFGFFCHAALEYLLQTGSSPDILHCHDWSSAPVSWLFKEHYMHYGLSKARVIFTIHNLEFGVHHIAKAMEYSDKATTVSYTYSKEVSGNHAIAPHLHKFHGIINGIDPVIWDPYTDNFIPVNYDPENVVEGKKAAKEALQRKLGLRIADQPLVGVISRLTVQKGIHLIKHAIGRTLERNGQFVLLGSAPDGRIQNDFVNLANELHNSHAGQARLCLTYDEPLSHLIYAGADFILVPSLFEPCGLTQLVAMRYGSIPVVRKTGGLYDTVFDVDNEKERARERGLEPNGFSFDGADSAGVDYALNRGITAWYDARDWFNSLCKRVMEQDWSWNRPALDYMELYHFARKQM